MSKKTCIIVVFALLLSLMATACGNSGETPEKAVTNALNAVKNFDKDTAQKYFDYNELFSNNSETDELIGEEHARLVFGKLSFKVLSSSKEGDTATVKTEITNIDMADVMVEYFRQAMALALENAFIGDNTWSEEETNSQMEQILIDLLKRDDNKTKTSTVDIKLSKHDDNWKIDINEELRDAVFGGIISMTKDMENIFGSSDSP